MPGVLLSSRAPFPKEENSETWMQWACDASDAVLERFRELQRPNLLSDALYAGCMTVLYRVPIKDFPFDLEKEDIILQDVVTASAHILTASVVRDLLKLSPQFQQPDINLVHRVFRESKAKNIKVSELIQQMGIDYQRVLPWLCMGNFLHPDIRYKIQHSL